jgi:sec-independent protein translocase protein TatB
MPSFSDSAFLIVLALLLFGPKKLPVLARQLGKLMADFRRASNEFRSQMEEELRISEQAERQKQVAALEAAAPAAPAPAIAAEAEVTSEAEHSHLAPEESDFSTAYDPIEPRSFTESDASPNDATATEANAPHPIAISGDLSLMPPSTGLPIPNIAEPSIAEPSISDALPVHDAELETETLHG